MNIFRLLSLKGAARWALQTDIAAEVEEARRTERVNIADELRHAGLDSLAYAVHTDSIRNWAAQRPDSETLQTRQIRKGLHW